MGTNECSQPASKSSWDSQDFGDVNMVLKMVHFRKSSRPQWVKLSRQLAAVGHGCARTSEAAVTVVTGYGHGCARTTNTRNRDSANAVCTYAA